jgi:hypothetical protein
VSQVLTLYTTPVIYLLMERIARRFGRTKAPEVSAGAEVEAVAGDGAA